MKISIALIAFLVGPVSVSASVSKYPTLSINIQDGSYGSLDGIDPLISYSTGTSLLGLDIEAGATASAKPTSDVLSLPRSIWGKISSDIAGWRLSSRVGLTDADYKNPTIDLAANSNDLDAYIKIGALNKVEVEKGFGALGGRISITPRYNIASSSADVTLEYDSDDTTVTIDASESKQKLTLSQQVASGHRITPTITSERELSVAWKKDLSGGDSVTTTVTPGDNINVKWEDGDWVAEFNSALDGFKTEGLNVRVHRKVTFV